MNKIEVKECKTHGLTDFVLRTDGRYRCKKCSMDAVIKRRKLLKIKSVEYKGGECQVCGYKRCYDALEFHHLNPEEKENIKLILDYADQAQRWPVVIYEPDMSSRMIKELGILRGRDSLYLNQGGIQNNAFGYRALYYNFEK